jgi:hypothetical protein
MPSSFQRAVVGSAFMLSVIVVALAAGCGSSYENSGATGGATATGTGTCTSGVRWTAQQGESQSMRPGEACIACHSSSSEAPTFSIAGTVYPSLADDNDCNGTNGPASGVAIVITDANGGEHRVTVNAAGNFMLEGVTIAKPYTARVERGTLQSQMASAQTSGDCNGCHTSTGANGAPGRILSP